MTEYDRKQQEIAKQERKGRYIVNSWFTNATLSKNWDIVTYHNNPQSAPVDLQYIISQDMEIATLTGTRNATVKTDCNIEVKTRYQTPEETDNYPSAILKVEKYNAMQQAIQGKDNAALYYAVILNDTTLYIYDVTDINRTPHTNATLPLKKIQYAKDSERVPTPCYLLPYNTAIRTVDITDYIRQYNTIVNADNIQTKEETATKKG